MKVKHDLLHLGILHITVFTLQEREDVREDLSFLLVCRCFSQVLGSILVQLRGIEEEGGFEK